MSAKQRNGKPGWDQEERKVHSNSKIKSLPDADQETLWLLMHPSDDTVTPYTVEACMFYLQEEHGRSVASSTFYEWHAWYQFKLRMDSAAERAEQARLELAKDPRLTPEDLDRAAQTVFTAETLQNRDVKGYVALAKLGLAKTKQQLDRDKLSAASKSQIEKGLDALLAEIQGNPKALALFKQLQEVVSKA